MFGGNNAYYYVPAGRDPRHRRRRQRRVLVHGAESRVRATTFDVVEDADADVLIVAHEDRTGASPVPTRTSTGPNYLAYYTDALDASGVSYDVFDVDAMGRQAPDHLGVLGHYDAVIWYTGNDFVTRQAGRGPGNIDRLANDLILEARAYLNEGGKLLYTGQWAGASPRTASPGASTTTRNDEARAWSAGRRARSSTAACRVLRRQERNDFLSTTSAPSSTTAMPAPMPTGTRSRWRASATRTPT